MLFRGLAAAMGKKVSHSFQKAICDFGRISEKAILADCLLKFFYSLYIEGSTRPRRFNAMSLLVCMNSVINEWELAYARAESAG